MSVTSRLSPSDQRGVRFIVWACCIGALVILAVLRAGIHDDANDYARMGLVVGALLGPFVIAALAGLLVQRAIRRRRGFPLWIGLLAVAISAAALFVEAGDDAAAQAACDRPGDAYGAPPAGWTYRKADEDQRRDVLEAMHVESRPDVDVTLAYRRDEPDGVLLSIVSPDAARQVTAFRRGVTEAGGRFGERDGVTQVDGGDGSRTSVATKGCTFVVATGFSRVDGERLARAVFGR